MDKPKQIFVTVFPVYKTEKIGIPLQSKVCLKVKNNEHIMNVAKEFANDISKENNGIKVKYEIFLTP